MSIIGFIIPPENKYPTDVNGEVVSSGSDMRLNEGTPVICRSYKEFEIFCKASNSNQLEEYAKELDKELFNNFNIVAVNIEIPDPSHSIYVTSAFENGTKLEIEYIQVSYPYVSTDVISYETIILFTSKSVLRVEMTRGENMDLDFYPEDFSYSVYSIATADPVAPYYPEDEGCFEGYFIFEDYESWAEFRDNGNWKFSNYTDIAANESFFERNNLVVCITTHSSGGYSLCFSDISESESDAKIELYSVYEPGIHIDAINYNAAMVAVSKDIKTADVNYHMIDVPFRIDGKVIAW